MSSDSFLQLVVWSQQKNYQENTFCQLSVPRAHKQDHLAIISSQSQKGKRMFIGEGGDEIVREEENKDRWIKRNGEKREEGELLEPRRGHGVPAERNSGKHP